MTGKPMDQGEGRSFVKRTIFSIQKLRRLISYITCLLVLFWLLAGCGGVATPQPIAPGPQLSPQPQVPVLRSIVFSAMLDEVLGFDIYRINSDGSGLTTLANNPARDMYPAWSPDGRLIAFCSDRQGKNELYLMSVNGSDQRRLTDTIDDCGIPSSDVPIWSPDGKWIAILSYPDADFPDGKAHIFLVNPQTGQGD